MPPPWRENIELLHIQQFKWWLLFYRESIGLWTFWMPIQYQRPENQDLRKLYLEEWIDNVYFISKVRKKNLFLKLATPNNNLKNMWHNTRLPYERLNPYFFLKETSKRSRGPIFHASWHTTNRDAYSFSQEKKVKTKRTLPFSCGI